MKEKIQKFGEPTESIAELEKPPVKPTPEPTLKELENLEYLQKVELAEERSVEIFNPQEELEKIRKLPAGEKRQKLEEFKARLAKQKEGIAELQENLVQLVRDKPDVSYAELKTEVEKAAKKFGLTEEQKLVARTILGLYKNRREKVLQAREQYPDDRKLFQAAFGQPPIGKIEVLESPAALYFRCYDPRDYAFTYSRIFLKGGKVGENDVAAANLSGAGFLDTTLLFGVQAIVENAPKVAPRYREGVKEHEEQHVLRNLFREGLTREALKSGAYQPENMTAFQLFLERHFRSWRESAEIAAKNEILAYLKSGEKPESVFETLTKSEQDGGIYDYLKPVREKQFSEFLTDQTPSWRDQYGDTARQAAKKVLEDEYRFLIKRGIAAFEILTKQMGYSKEKATALLLKEPLIKWPKVIMRLYEQKIESEKK